MDPSSQPRNLVSEATVPATAGSGFASDWFDQGSSSCGQACAAESCGRIFDQKYVSFFGGFTNIDNFERILRTPTSRFIDGADLRSGYAGGAAFGGVIQQVVRNEVEFTYRNTSVGSFFNQEFDNDDLLVANATAPAVGSVHSYSGMYNVLLDVGKRCVGMPHLYVGGGLGAIYVDGNFDTAAESFSVQDPAFAYQVIGGINYPVRDSVDLYTEYRFLGADNVNVENVTTGVSLGDFTYDSHNVMFGVRFRR